MRIAIIDDEKKDADELMAVLNHGSELYNVPNDIKYYSSGTDFFKEFNRGKFDLIYMDIVMPKMSGIDAGLHLREIDPEVPLVFVTKSTEYMAEAFSCHAFDYIIKPATFDRICFLMRDVLRTYSIVGYFEVIENGCTLRILDNTLVSISVSGHTTCILTCDGVQHNVRQSFSSVTEQVSQYDNFLLVNRGILVCMDYISEFTSDSVIMQTGHTFSVNLRKHNELENKWHEYTFAKLRREQRKNPN